MGEDVEIPLSRLAIASRSAIVGSSARRGSATYAYVSSKLVKKSARRTIEYTIEPISTIPIAMRVLGNGTPPLVLAALLGKGCAACEGAGVLTGFVGGGGGG